MWPVISHGKSHGNSHGTCMERGNLSWDMSTVGSHGISMGLPMDFPMKGGGLHETSHWTHDEPHGQSDGASHGKPYGYYNAYDAKSHVRAKLSMGRRPGGSPMASSVHSMRSMMHPM